MSENDETGRKRRDRRSRRNRRSTYDHPERPDRIRPVQLICGWLIMLLVINTVIILPAQYMIDMVWEVSNFPRLTLRFFVPTLWIIMLFLLFRLVGRLFYRRYLKNHTPYKRNPFAEAMEALDEIATGNFDVLLDVDDENFAHINELAQKINELAKGLGATERMRQDFVANVSHEIQSPLTSIGGFAALLRQEDLDPDTRNHYLEIIEAETARLSKLSDNLLRLSALDAESRPLELETYRLDRQIESALLLLEPQWSEKDLELEVNTARLEITGDRDLLSQVWINLINNSVKFTPEGGKLTISLAAEEDTAVFTLADTGIGMSRETVERVFERFYKADAARMRAKGGNGLGLSIVQKIVSLHGGDIRVESEEGKGSTFTVTLPLYGKKEG